MKRAVRSLIRLVACGFAIFGGMEIVLEYVRHRARGTTVSVSSCVIGALLIVVGVIVFAFSTKLAETLADNFDFDE
jgi:hypothetical protein